MNANQSIVIPQVLTVKLMEDEILADLFITLNLLFEARPVNIPSLVE